MKLTVFGATGGTGQQVVQQALDAGHTVTVVARRPAAVAATGAELRLVRAELSDHDALRDGIQGADAVVSALGATSGGPTTVYSAGVGAVLAAMSAAGVRRVVAVTAAPAAPKSQKAWSVRLADPIVYRFFGGHYADMKRMEAALARSDRDWTVVRPPRLTDGPATGRFRTAVDAGLPWAMSISRADLATAVLAAVTDDAVVGRAVTVGY